jgi:hypothetical protein
MIAHQAATVAAVLVRLGIVSAKATLSAAPAPKDLLHT